jgi:hypothetical protein
MHVRVPAKEKRPTQFVCHFFHFLTFPHPGTTRYLRRRQEAEAAAAAAQGQGQDPRDDADTASPISPIATSPQSLMSPSSLGPNSPPYLEPSLGSLPSVPPVPIPPSRYPIAADNFHPQYSSSPVHSSSFNSPRSGDPSGSQHSPRSEHPFGTPSTEYGSYNQSVYNHWGGGSFGRGSNLSHLSSPQSFPSLRSQYRPHRLEEIVERDTVSLIIALFFDFVYPLTPCVHKPSFMADLHARREERDPLFFALVMSTVASTLVQVPRSYLPMDRPAVRKLAAVIPFPNLKSSL